MIRLAQPSPQQADAIRQASINNYRSRAAKYDLSCGPTWPFRERAIANLALRTGDVVLDVGCGTGLSFGLLRDGVGPEGHIIGIDQSPEMIRYAHQRVADNGWDNVTVLMAPAHDVVLPAPVSAILFNYTHDICRCEASLANLFGQAEPGARIGMAGVKYFSRWAGPLNWFVYLKNRGYNGYPGDLHKPWSKVLEYAPDLKIEPTQLGMGYVARGTLR